VTLVQRQLGHRSLLATQVYTQLADIHAEALLREVRL
jgi:site-specific recombinase XerD